jgi:hypothetical protein
VEEHLTPEAPGAPAPVPDGPDRGARRVAALDAALALATVPLLAWLHGYPRPTSLAVAVGVGLLFLVAEWFPVDVAIREQGHTVAFTAVPLIVGLCTLPPVIVVGLRLAASLVVLGIVQRQAITKFVTNVVSHALQVAVAGAIIVPFVGRVPNGPADWLVAAAAVVAAEVAGTAVVTLAITLWEGEFDRSYLEGTMTGWLVLAPDAALGLVTAIVLDASPSAVALLAILGLSLGAVVRGYAVVTTRYRVMEVLGSFTDALGAAVVDDRLHRELLDQLRARLHAGTAWIASDGDPALRIVARQGTAELTAEPLPPAGGPRRRAGSRARSRWAAMRCASASPTGSARSERSTARTCACSTSWWPTPAWRSRTSAWWTGSGPRPASTRTSPPATSSPACPTEPCSCGTWTGGVRARGLRPCSSWASTASRR